MVIRSGETILATSQALTVSAAAIDPGQGNGQNPGTPGNPVTPAKPGVAGQPGSSVGGGLANTGADGWLTLLPLSLILLIGGLGGLLLVDIRRKRLSE